MDTLGVGDLAFLSKYSTWTTSQAEEAHAAVEWLNGSLVERFDKHRASAASCTPACPLVRDGQPSNFGLLDAI